MIYIMSEPRLIADLIGGVTKIQISIRICFPAIHTSHEILDSSRLKKIQFLISYEDKKARKNISSSSHFPSFYLSVLIFSLNFNY